MSTNPKLSPKADLIMETLVARVRLGEPFWSFEKRHAKAIQELSDIGYVRFGDGYMGSIRVWLEDAGRAAWMVGDYDPQRPLREDNEQLRRAADTLMADLMAAHRAGRAQDARIAQLEGQLARARAGGLRPHRAGRVRRTSQG